jgi:hypothetical protein
VELTDCPEVPGRVIAGLNDAPPFVDRAKAIPPQPIQSS